MNRLKGKAVSIIVCLATVIFAVFAAFSGAGKEPSADLVGGQSDVKDALSSPSDAPESTYVLDTVEEGSLALDCKSAILMEASTGMILYRQNVEERLPPASVTKIMTLLLIMEAIEGGRIALDDTVTVSARAASMGGSQIFLEEGERMSVEDLLKSVIICSANDAAVALAEFTYGSEEAFVAEMNKKAAELGMDGSVFENTNGLDDTVTEHLTNARDIAIMSRELIKHEKVIEYSSLWMDTIRDGAFGLTNTNRLVRYYPGCTGLKTGSTAKAGFCVSVTAERDGMGLICVIMGAKTRDIRNAQATKLLDWGFANYGIFSADGGNSSSIKVMGGVNNICKTEFSDVSFVLPKGDISKVTTETSISDTLKAPIKKGDAVGRITYSCGEKIVGYVDIIAAEDCERIGYSKLIKRILAAYSLKGS